MNGLTYENILEMISCFQWIPDDACLRLTFDGDTRDSVMDSITIITSEISKVHEKSSENYSSVIPKTMFNSQGILLSKQSSEVITMAQQVIEFIEVDAELIGIVNLCSVAYALVLRELAADRWNRFCYDVDKPDWITDTKKQHSKFSRSVGPSVATSSSNVAQHIPDNGHDDPDGNTDELSPEVRQRHSGLAAAFDDRGFNQHVDEMLGGGDVDEVSENEQMPVTRMADRSRYLKRTLDRAAGTGHRKTGGRRR